MTDQNATTHTYLHDVLGRLTADAVTTLGSGVSGSVRLHAYSFTPLGEPYLSSSYSGTTPSPTPTNQVEDVYNGLGQLTQEYQSHAGAVITTPTPTATASVTYAYSGLGSSSQNYSRLSSVTYPDGEVISYGYNNSTLDNAISRVDFLSQGGSHVLDDTYLGLATVANAAYGDGVTLSYFTSGSSASDSGDEYTGLDRFDRTIEQKYATTTPTPTTTDDFTYGYDADGNVLYQNVPIATSFGQLYHANSTASGDNATAYDPLDRESAFRRGVLSASGNNGASLDTVATASVSDTYSLDALGNQAAVNSQNELTGTLLAYNNDGDQTESPAGGGYCNCYTYDAWNAMVAYTSACSCGTACETMGYDALGREISDTYNPVSGGSGVENKYYSAGGQVLQDTCVCTCGCGCGCTCTTTTDNFVWAPDYVDDLVLRDRTISGTTTRLYAQHDANFDVTALVNTSGTVTERFAYDPYGNVTVLTGAWGGSSDNTWQVRFQGMWLDNTTGQYKTLNRDYSATEARWVEADPAGYVDGSSMFQFGQSAPVEYTDPLGLCGCPAATQPATTRSTTEPATTQSTTRPATTQSTTGPSAGLQDIIARLSDDNWRNRDKAQRDLELALKRDPALLDDVLKSRYGAGPEAVKRIDEVTTPFRIKALNDQLKQKRAQQQACRDERSRLTKSGGWPGDPSVVDQVNKTIQQQEQLLRDEATIAQQIRALGGTVDEPMLAPDAPGPGA